jgi:hypothetical protein
LRNLFFVAAEKRKFVYEIWPGLFGNSLTPNEWEYWIAFFILQQAEIRDIPRNIYDIERVIELINSKERKMKRELREMSNRSSRRIIYDGS